MRFLLISLLGLLTLPTADAKEDTFKQEKARYRAYLERQGSISLQVDAPEARVRVWRV